MSFLSIVGMTVIAIDTKQFLVWQDAFESEISDLDCGGVAVTK
jgi:hypothetical protein